MNPNAPGDERGTITENNQELECETQEIEAESNEDIQSETTEQESEHENFNTEEAEVEVKESIYLTEVEQNDENIES